MNKFVQGFCHAKKAKFDEDAVLFLILKTKLVLFFRFDCKREKDCHERESYSFTKSNDNDNKGRFCNTIASVTVTASR